jgi:protein O-mannosyl-transferase
VGRSLLVAFAVVVVFSPVLANDWVSWDDPEALVQNEELRAPGVVSWAFTTDRMSHFQPLSWLLWSATGRILGTSPQVFHGLSLALHVLNALLLYLLMMRLGVGRNASLVATLLYAVHPLRVEPVAWASAAPYLLATALLVLSTLLYLRASVAPSALAYAASLLARPIGLGFPLVLLALDVFPGKRKLRASLFIEKIPHFLLALVALVLEGRSRRFLDVGTYGIGARLTLAAGSLLSSLSRLLWPVGLTPLDPLPLEPKLDLARVALAGSLLVAAAVGVWWSRARFPAAPPLFLSWLILLVPTLGLAPSGLQATADRYGYVPGLVLAIAIAAALVQASSRVQWAGLVVVAVLGVGAYRQCRWWKDSVTLWGRAGELDPGNDLALYFDAGALAAAGRLDEARTRYEEVLALVPDHAPAKRDLALLDAREADALAAKGDLSSAVPLYRTALERDPGRGDARERLGMVLFQLGRYREALPELEAACGHGPSAADVCSACALVLTASGRNQEAASVLKEAIRRFPDDLTLAHNLARLLATGGIPGRAEEALALAESVVEKTGRSDPRALDTLAFALAAAGRRDDALQTFEEASRLARARGANDLALEIDAHALALGR